MFVNRGSLEGGSAGAGAGVWYVGRKGGGLVFRVIFKKRGGLLWPLLPHTESKNTRASLGNRKNKFLDGYPFSPANKY